MADKDLTARLVVYNLDTMDDEEHKRLIHWLEQRLREMRKAKRVDYSSRFTARLFKWVGHYGQ